MASLTDWWRRIVANDGVAQTIMRGGAISFVLATCGLLIGFLSHVLLSRALGVEQYGFYAVAVGWTLIIAPLATAGMDYTVLRFAPPLVIEGAWGTVRRLAFHVTFVLIVTNLMVLLALLVATRFLPEGFGHLGHQGAVWMAVLILATTFLSVFSAFFRAAQRIFENQFYQQIVRSLLLVATIGALLATGARLDALTALIITAATALVALALMLVHFGWTFSARSKSDPPDIAWRELLGMGGVTVLINLIQQALVQGNVVFLGLLSTPAEAGLYSVAARLSVLVTFGLSALASITAPMIVAAHAQGDRRRMQRIATVNARLAATGALTVAVVLAVCGRLALRAFGAEFEAAYPALLVLLVSGLVVSAGGASANILLLTGRQLQVLGSLALAAVGLVISNLFMTQDLGALGAASSALMAVALSSCTMVWHVIRTYRVNPTIVGSAHGESEGKQ